MRAVEQRLQHLMDALVTPNSIADYPAYREQVGRIMSLREIAGMCEDANETLQKQARGEY
jgi:hypothetical protein